MSYPQVQFVASPDAGAAVRFDFNTGTEGSDGQTKVLHNSGFSLGAPTLQGDPDGIGTEYGLRELSIPLRVNGTAATAAAKLGALAREMGRQTNWLRFQATPTSSPVWFQTYRSSPVPLDWEQVRGTSPTAVSQWDIDVKLDADDLAYGALVTALNAVTVTNDPATGTNPCKVLLPAIQGDAPAALTVEAKPNVVLDNTTTYLAVATRSEAATPMVEEFPSFTQVGTGDSTAVYDTAPVVTGAAYSGGSARAIAFASNPTDLLTRVSVPRSLVPGTYQVLVRLVVNDSSTFDVQGVWGNGGALGGTTMGDVVPVNWGARAAWVNLGVAANAYMPRVSPNVPLGVITGFVNIMARRNTGTGSLVVDTVLIVPVDLPRGSEATTLFTRWNGNGPNGTYAAYFDGDTDSAALRFADTGPTYFYRNASPIPRGSPPKAWPGRDNTLILLQQAGSPAAESSDTLTGTWTVTVTYRPRLLWLGVS